MAYDCKKFRCGQKTDYSVEWQLMSTKERDDEIAEMHKNLAAVACYPDMTCDCDCHLLERLLK